MKNKPNPFHSRSIFVSSKVPVTALAALLLGFTASQSQAQTTGFLQTGAGPFDYNDTANWVDSDGVAGPSAGDINGIWDASLTLLAAQTVEFSADTTLSTALDFQCFGSQNIVLRGTGGAKTITLGGDITSNVSVNKAVTIGSGTAANNLNVDLGGVTRTFTAGSSKTLTLTNVVSSGGLITSGGTINFSAANTYSGTTTVTSGVFALNGAVASAVNSDFTVLTNGNNATSLQFNSNTNGNTGTTRAKSVTLNGGIGGATWSVTGNGTANSIDVITNALTASGGYGIVSVSANANRNARLEAATFVRSAGSGILFRGPDLGVSEIDSLVAGDANIKFGSAPALVGAAGAAGSTTLSILKGAYGEIVSGGTGSTGGLVTYDSTHGIRVLNSGTEYMAAITDGQTALENVRIARATGDASKDMNLVQATTTLNSLSFNVTGAGTDSGVTLSGDAGTTLKLNSGTVFANQTVTTPTATDKILVAVPKLDLNASEGVIIVGATTGQSGAQSNINAPLQIDSEITNDGGLGLTKAGGGHLRLGGAIQNTYTGNTVLTAGVLYLAKSVTNIALPDANTFVINGGSVYQSNNQLPDNANVVINGGAWAISGSASNGNSSSETFNNLTMTGGSLKNGQSNGGTTNILGFANLSGGTFSAIGSGSNVTVTGATSISNGAVVSLGASSNTTGNSKLTLNGGLAITNTASGAYTPISISASGTAANLGGRLILGSDVTFTGNVTNANTTTIQAVANTGPLGTLELNGTRTFNIGNGAAAVDLTITPTLVDGGTVGGLLKTGAGTLALTGSNTYTGNTTVNGGTLSLGAATLDDARTVNVVGSAVLNLAHGVSDIVAEFQIDGVSQGSGTFTSAHPSGRITGAGSLQVGASSDPFAAWIDSFTSLTNPADKTKTADPDMDGLTNAAEFALDGNPASGTASGKVRSQIETVGADQALVITLPVRAGAVFDNTPGPAADATIDNMTYSIEGSNNLVAFDQGVTEIAVSAVGMPALTSASWTYKTFRLNGAIGGGTPRGPKGFLRVMVVSTP